MNLMHIHEQETIQQTDLAEEPGVSQPVPSEDAIVQISNDTLATRVPPHYASLVRIEAGVEDPINRQSIASPEEAICLPEESSDPLDERRFSPVPNLIHRYKDRVLFLATDHCAMYCRHCFRRHHTGKQKGPATEEMVDEAARYIEGRTDIHEILVSGGDPLTMEDTRLFSLLRRFAAIREGLIIRLCTRVPVVDPERITESFVGELRRICKETHTVLFVMTQFNHPREIVSQAVSAIDLFVDGGIPVMNQTVLLRGVNDDVEVLEQLMRSLVSHRIKPYYLFQGDLARGTSHFRVDLDEGIQLVKELQRRLSGLAMPTYAVDLPGGGGKVRVLEQTILHPRPGVYDIVMADGSISRYCDPPRSTIAGNLPSMTSCIVTDEK